MKNVTTAIVIAAICLLALTLKGAGKKLTPGVKFNQNMNRKVGKKLVPTVKFAKRGELN